MIARAMPKRFAIISPAISVWPDIKSNTSFVTPIASIVPEAIISDVLKGTPNSFASRNITITPARHVRKCST